MSASRWLGWMPLGLAVLLLTFELSVLAVGLFGPRVSPAYRAYFIERRVDLWAGEPLHDSGRISR